MSAEFAQACDFKFATPQWFTPVPGLGPELCHDRGLALPHPWDFRGLALPHPWDCVGVTLAVAGHWESPLLWFRDWHVAGV